MQVLYTSSYCEKSIFNSIFKVSEVKPQQQAQKFHFLLSRGLLENVSSITYITRTPAKIYDGNTVVIRNETYHHLKIGNNRVLNSIFIRIQASYLYINWLIKNKGKEKVIISDVLTNSVTFPVMLLAKFTKVNIVGVVTDLPTMLDFNNNKPHFFKKTIASLSLKIIKRFDAFVLITEQMNNQINKNFKKPYLIMEGLVEKNCSREIKHQIKTKKKNYIDVFTMVYTGGLYEKFGVNNLIDAFMLLEGNHLRLEIYGAGESEKYIKEAASKDRRIIFGGTVENEIAVQRQKTAQLLVNPRPNSNDFTKYSFPSKLMEYLNSGTPVITTKLDGIPQEYDSYFLYFNDESVTGLNKTLSTVTQMPREELEARGQRGMNFVQCKKNNLTQSKRIIKMIEELK